MAVPRLADPGASCAWTRAGSGAASPRPVTIAGAAALGTPVRVVGSVAVNRRGARIGKGGGCSDLEFALAWVSGAVDARTVVATTVHDLQVVAGPIPMTSHDVPVDIIVTPTRALRCPRTFARPRRIEWRALTPHQLHAMPSLASLRRTRRRR